jgi:hypothetical protein
MYKKLFIFMFVVAAFVAGLVYFDRTRGNPWSSDVVFGALGAVFAV